MLKRRDRIHIIVIFPREATMKQRYIYMYIMHYTLNYDFASSITKGNIDKWRVSLRVIYQDQEGHQHPLDGSRCSSTNNGL